MNTALAQPLIVRSRVSSSGFLVALVLAVAFLAVGLKTLEVSLVPPRLGVFVEPPSWFFAALLVGFAAFMFLVGVSEVARFIRPATELVIDRDGISTFGLFGERRAFWADLIASEFQQGTLSLKLRAKGRMPPPDMRLHFDRLDVDPPLVFAAIRAHRPDLIPGAEDR
jgi:hypothetical protein